MSGESYWLIQSKARRRADQGTNSPTTAPDGGPTRSPAPQRGVKPHFASSGEISELHVGLKGTMNALFLKDLADKTRRGLRGRVAAGRSAGGRCYGYDVVRAVDARGEPLRGGRAVNAAEAAVVRRIFPPPTLSSDTRMRKPG